MNTAQKESAPRPLDRINFRLDPETFEALDQARARRPGNVSRNTWISEAVEEKLTRETASNHRQLGPRK